MQMKNKDQCFPVILENVLIQRVSNFGNRCCNLELVSFCGNYVVFQCERSESSDSKICPHSVLRVRGKSLTKYFQIFLEHHTMGGLW
mmetsp:Transcript_20545/g.27212  ORF Transcript_20545/g.27212 Transcript_20545/m.27212 type:complete len:87 (-) Transcript_20545:122-382(-)